MQAVSGYVQLERTRRFRAKVKQNSFLSSINSNPTYHEKCLGLCEKF